jgi:hypothetical protein
VTLDMLGRAKRARIDKENTTNIETLTRRSILGVRGGSPTSAGKPPQKLAAHSPTFHLPHPAALLSFYHPCSVHVESLSQF